MNTRTAKIAMAALIAGSAAIVTSGSAIAGPDEAGQTSFWRRSSPDAATEASVAAPVAQAAPGPIYTQGPTAADGYRAFYGDSNGYRHATGRRRYMTPQPYGE